MGSYIKSLGALNDLGLGFRIYLLGGAWVVISRHISPVIWVATIVTLIITSTYNFP